MGIDFYPRAMIEFGIGLQYCRKYACKRSTEMTNKTTLFLLGVCVGAAAPLMAKALKPLGVYAFAGGMIAYEVACDVIEDSKEALRESFENIRHS